MLKTELSSLSRFNDVFRHHKIRRGIFSRRFHPFVTDLGFCRNRRNLLLLVAILLFGKYISIDVKDTGVGEKIRKDKNSQLSTISLPEVEKRL